MDEPAITVSGLHCRYGDFEAVRGVDFEVGRGELFALLGTNGAGKTTTMEVLEGHRAPHSGAVRVLGLRPDADRRRLRPRMGVMLQESGFSGDLTVAETLGLWRALGSRPSDVDEAVERLDLGHRRDVRVRQLSGGERRRLDLAVATLGSPEVLFLDEPTTGLDPQSRARTWEVVRDLLAGGTTVLLTTHYLEEAEQLADRLAILHEGRIAVAGTLMEVLDAQSARITFTRPADLALTDLPALSAAPDPADFAAGTVRVRTRDLQDDLALLLAWAERAGVRLARLRAQHASLSDVFHAVNDKVVTTR